MIRPPWKYRVKQADVQGNVLANYGIAYRHALYAFVRIEDDVAGRAWLGATADQVTTAERRPDAIKPDYAINVSVSCNGLRALGLPEPLLKTFPEDFRVGMRARAESLGDTGPNDPQHWEDEVWHTEPHVMVTLFALDQPALDQGRTACLSEERLGSDLAVQHEQPAGLLERPGTGEPMREHFGFADGFAQPTIKGNAGPYSRRGGGTAIRFGRWRDVAPGEFVLGYPAEDGTYADCPAPPLRPNGTYTVVRKLEQRVAAFRDYCRELSPGDPDREEWIAAGIVGRWRDGTPLMKSPNEADPELARDTGPESRVNDFRYKHDPVGETCPLGAHIRRANPRDSLGWQGRLTKRHRIIRRGMPYGRDPAQEECGLMFVCHQASISRQFEVIQGQWLNDGDAFWVGGERDLLTAGDVDEGMTLQGHPPVFLPRPKQPFVVTRGGGYFFTPGIRALRTIAAGAWE